MGKYMKKGKVMREIVVMEVAAQIRTTRALDMSSEEVNFGTKTKKMKKRKVEDGELKPCKRRRVINMPEDSVSPANLVDYNRCSSPSSDHLLSSCNSSNGSSRLLNDDLPLLDLEEECEEIGASLDNKWRTRREKTPSSSELGEEEEFEEDLESEESSSSSMEKKKKSEANSRLGSTSLLQKMPSESEIEEFFSSVEKDIQKKFTDKYNYDVVKDMPLEGRYEWIQLKP
ncbi:Cyclin-dependent kinase inhibitor domain [Dillenia turbinata]|uniref:Cyclin-dependent kinase inhibitor domain n=1 Tax=Dillenia turbinata TaxID=194707 RepID=A0AAN8UW79_9MAGN